jgi:hypothetical protein
LDICRITLGLITAHKKAIDGLKDPTIISSSAQPIIIQQQNTFLYPVQKPRREPIEMTCAKSAFQRTIRSSAFDAYVLEKAREIRREFSYRDFLELKHASFRRIVLRLRRKGKIIANPQRTNPRYYILAERLPEYQLSPKTLR